MHACVKVTGTSLSDIIEVHATITTLWCGIRGFMSQSINILFAKKVNKLV